MTWSAYHCLGCGEIFEVDANGEAKCPSCLSSEVEHLEDTSWAREVVADADADGEAGGASGDDD